MNQSGSQTLGSRVSRHMPTRHMPTHRVVIIQNNSNAPRKHGNYHICRIEKRRKTKLIEELKLDENLDDAHVTKVRLAILVEDETLKLQFSSCNRHDPVFQLTSMHVVMPDSDGRLLTQKF